MSKVLSLDDFQKQYGQSLPVEEWDKIYGSQQSAAPDSDNRTAGQVALDQAGNVLKGIPQAITGIPGTLAAVGGIAKDALTGNTTGALGGVGNLARGMMSPFEAVAKTVTGNPPPPQDPSWAAGAQGAGAMLGGALLGTETAQKGIAGGLRAVAKPLERSAVNQQVKALTGPGASTESIEQARGVAPDLAAEQDFALTGRRYDALQKSKLGVDRVEWEAASESVPKNAPVNIQALKDTFQQQIDDLTGVPGAPTDSIATIANEVTRRSTPGTNTIEFGKLNSYRRTLDDMVERLGGYKATGSDALRVSQLRDASNAIRDTLAKYDDRLAAANDALSKRLKVQDIIEQRSGTQANRDVTQPRRFPIIGTPGDDLLATTGGYLLGGPLGAGVAEGANLLRQSRGVSSMRSALSSKMGQGARSMANRLSPPYAGLLDQGYPLPEGGQDMGSGINVTTGGVPPRGLLQQGYPLPEPTELPSGGSEMKVGTEKNPYYKQLTAEPGSYEDLLLKKVKKYKKP